MPMEPKSFYHNRTLLIQGGSALLDQYYHLTLAQHSAVIALLTPPGIDKQVIFNNALAWGAASNLYWDEINGRLGIGMVPTGNIVDIYGAVNPRIKIASGVNTAPGISFAQQGQTSMALYNVGSTNDLQFYCGGELIRVKSSGFVGILTTAPTNILSFGGNAARKIWMERHTTADTAGNNLTIQAGGCTASATSKDGGMLYLAPGTPTGVAKSSLRIQRFTRGAAATTDNTLKDAIIVPSEFNLTDEAANSIFEVALPTLTTFCGRMIFGVNVSNGTDTQAYQGNLDITAENKGGVYTSTIPESTSTFSATSASTLTLAWSIVTGADKITITLTPTSSLVPTSMKLIYTLINNSNQAVTQL